MPKPITRSQKGRREKRKALGRLVDQLSGIETLALLNSVIQQLDNRLSLRFGRFELLFGEGHLDLIRQGTFLGLAHRLDRIHQRLSRELKTDHAPYSLSTGRKAIL